MKQCTCGAIKWKGSLTKGIWECLKCYNKYTTKQLKKLKDKNEKPKK